MIIPEYSAIINIEVKRGSNDSSDKLKFQKGKLKLLEEASDQTIKHFSFMQKLFGGMLSKDWVFVRAACVPHLTINEETTHPCVNCQLFILQDVNDVTPWLKQIINHKLVTSDYDQTVYEELVAELIYHISIKESSKFDKLISDPLTVSRETEEALTGKAEGISGENDVPVYMLNNEQLQAVHSTAKFLIIDGDYGTGKTYVLKERAKKCARNDSKDQLFYINLTALSYYNIGQHFQNFGTSVMEIIATKDFESYPNIKVISSKDLGIMYSNPNQTDIMNALNRFLRSNHCDHLFIDEMIIEEYDFPDSIKTICVSLKIIFHDLKLNTREFHEYKKSMWLKTMKVNHKAVHNLYKNMRNSQQIIQLAESLDKYSTQQLSCSPYTNVMGNHNFHYKNIYGINSSLLVVAAVNKFFIHKPKESVVILAEDKSYVDDEELEHVDRVFQLLHKHFSSTTSVVRNFREYMKKPEGILVTSIEEFQGAQARNIIICGLDIGRLSNHVNTRNIILRTMSHAIIILEKHNNKLNGSGAIEDKNLHEYIHPGRKAPVCYHYHNKDKHDISVLTMAILEKYKLFDQDESVAIITYSRISKDIIREANTKEFLSLPEEEKQKQVKKKIKLENRELYEDVKRNISRNFADISCSYYNTREELKNLVNKPRHVNYINMDYVPDLEQLSEFKNIIVYADDKIYHKREFAAWGNYWSLYYSDNKTSIKVERSKEKRKEYDTFCRDVIMLSQPKFAIVVHDGDFDVFSGPMGALNLVEDDNLHEHIPIENLNTMTEEGNITTTAEKPLQINKKIQKV